MTSIRLSTAALAVLLGILLPALAWAAGKHGPLDMPAPQAGQEAWLVTYGPGEIYWQRFGHNAIWLREPGLGLDHVFNFGYFDFRQKNFLMRFIRGRMLYFSLARPAGAEFSDYRAENRSITVRRLNLQPGQYRRMRDGLLAAVRPENRDYLYDYYRDNCSTRVRDVLDTALDGALREQFEGQSARLNFRAHTRRMTAMDFWYYLGLETALGMPVDREISRWEEMFLPAVVSESMAAVILAGAAGGRPLAGAQHPVFEAVAAAPPANPVAVWPRYLAVGLLLAAGGWLAGRYGPPMLGRALVLSWGLLAATAGLLLAGLWGLTDHAAAAANANILLLNPLFLFALTAHGRRVAALLVAVTTAVAGLLALAPGGQYNLDVLALAAPLNLACASFLWRYRAA
jgi:hypothetical protein